MHLSLKINTLCGVPSPVRSDVEGQMIFVAVAVVGTVVVVVAVVVKE